MQPSEFFAKLTSRFLWLHLLAMALVVVAVCLGVKFGLDVYTHHGEAIVVPDVRKKSNESAQQMLLNLGLEPVVADTGYVRNLPPGSVLAQSPEGGVRVKSGHQVILTINATHSPTIALPDIIDNSSLREAMAKLTAMGFRLGHPQYVTGERDWVYGILADGRQVTTGDRISTEATIVIQVGNGLRDEDDSISIVDAPQADYDSFEEIDPGDVDDFEEVSTPPEKE